MQGFSGYTLNAGEMNTPISGKSQYNYALRFWRTSSRAARLFNQKWQAEMIENIDRRR